MFATKTFLFSAALALALFGTATTRAETVNDDLVITSPSDAAPADAVPVAPKSLRVHDAPATSSDDKEKIDFYKMQEKIDFYKMQDMS